MIFFIAYLVYPTHGEVDALSFGFSIAFSMMMTSMIHVFLQTTRIDFPLVGTILVSLLIFFGFTLIFDATCESCLAGQSPYQVSYTMFRQGIFWLTNLFTIITAMLPRFFFKCIYNTTKNPLLRDEESTVIRPPTEVARFWTNNLSTEFSASPYWSIFLSWIRWFEQSQIEIVKLVKRRHFYEKSIDIFISSIVIGYAFSHDCIMFNHDQLGCFFSSL